MSGWKPRRLWTRFWMQFAGWSAGGRLATRLAEWGLPPYKGRRHLVRFGKHGYVSSNARIHHGRIRIEPGVFIGDNVDIFQNENGGEVHIGSGAHIHRDCIIETGEGGSLRIGRDTHIQPRCQLSAYAGDIRIGSCVQVAPNSGLYPYNHGFSPNRPIKDQPLISSGPIVVEDDAWIGFGVVILENTRIGEGAVVAAGAVVTRDVPPYAIVAGNPARVLRYRGDSPPEENGPS